MTVMKATELEIKTDESKHNKKASICREHVSIAENVIQVKLIFGKIIKQCH